MRLLKRFWYNLCMSVSLMFLRWAGEDPDDGRLKYLLSKDSSDLTPDEIKEIDRLTKDADVVIMG